MITPMPPRMEEKTGKPTAPKSKYATREIMHCRGVKNSTMNTITKVCRVTGITQIGTETHAETVRRAIESPQKTTVRVLDKRAEPRCCFKPF